MKLSTFFKTTCQLAIAIFVMASAGAQTQYSSQVIDLKLNGTSNIHNWTIKAVNCNSDVNITVVDGKVISLSKLDFILPVVNLKSEFTAMDKNTYRALRADKNPTMEFVSSNATVTPTTLNSYQIKCEGRMTIAGSTKTIELLAIGKYNPSDKSFTVVGVKKLKMTDYDVSPPKALLGTIKTGDDITISYDMKFNK